ncbi:hypothetical protein Tco_1481795, partial [Tanacetum coccineum]
DGNESNNSGLGTHHYASPLTTIIPGVHHSKDDTHAHSGDDTHVYSSGGGLFCGESTEQLQRRASVSSGHVMSSSSGGSGRQAFPKRNAGADGAGSNSFPC